MIRRPPRSTRTDTLFPYTTLFRSTDRPFLILRGKGGKERLAPISDRARAAIAQWSVHVAAESAWLFPSGKSHLSRIRLYQMVKELAAAAGITPERVSPHVLRHAFATHLLRSEEHTSELQSLMRISYAVFCL